ncbi:MAG: M3 family metallopeptidase [Pseudomonadota bacterium]
MTYAKTLGRPLSRNIAVLTATASAFALLTGCSAAYSDNSGNERAVATANEVAVPAIPQATGYFASDSDLPFHAPDFTKISEADYIPAFEQGMAIHSAEVRTIIANSDAPTFENTIVALEKSGAVLGRVSSIFFQLTGTNTTDGLDAINTEISPKLTAHGDSITLNPDLFARVKAVYENRANLGLDVEDTKLLERTYNTMVHAGALLTDEQREQVKAINSKLSTMTTEFGQMARDAMADQPLIVDTREELAGMSDSDIQAAAKFAEELGQPGKFAIALQNTTQQPLIPALDNRETREKLFKLSYNRADGRTDIDTRDVIAQIALLRAEKAALFGEPDWASYTMYDRMAKKPATALAFMEQMVPALAATQRREAGMLNEAIAAEGKNHTVQPWDWYRYANQIKAEQFDLDQDAVMEYFVLDRVLEDGIFFMAKELYGITFERRTDLPVYHPDVSVYTVFEEDGTELGLFYFDPFQRPSKRGGAWMGNFVYQSYMTGNKPVIYNVLNIPKAAEGEVQLVSFDWVETAFHEFGHAAHGFFADQKYETLSGTATARDFVEYPSQVHEMWAVWPSVLENYAKHYKTGETIPADMIEKIEAAGKFGQGYDFGETMEAALLDMKWHALSPEDARALVGNPEAVDAFERKSLTDLGLEIDLVPPRYRSTYFNHIFSSPAGYSAGYYSYLWTQMLDHDSRNWFRANGGLNRTAGQHYRETVLSRGGTMDYDVMYRNFADRDPDVQYMLEALGLTGSGE